VRREQNKRADELCNLALDGMASRDHQPAENVRQPAKSVLPRKAHLPDRVREEALDCLRSVAVAWADGNPNHPRPEEVWEQLWTILEDGGVLKTVRH
jgi:hypothetical protein